MHMVVKQISRTFSSCMTETQYPLNSNFPLPLTPAPGNHHSTFSLMSLTTLDISRKWNHAVFALLWLAYFVRFIHVVAYGRISFLFMANQYSSVGTYIFFIHSFVNGHLGYLPLLVTMNNATVNMRVQVSIWDSNFNSFWVNTKK